MDIDAWDMQVDSATISVSMSMTVNRTVAMSMTVPVTMCPVSWRLVVDGLVGLLDASVVSDSGMVVRVSIRVALDISRHGEDSLRSCRMGVV
jgi:hypothetical protein